MFEEIEFPSKSWRQAPPPRALRGERAEFTPEQQVQYEQLLGTVKSGLSVKVACPRPAGSPGVTVYGTCGTMTVGGTGIDSSVRIRLLDKEGYVFQSRRIDADFVAVRLREEVLRCSKTGTLVNAVEWQKKHGVRLRRLQPSPFSPDGLLVPPTRRRSRSS